MIEIDADDEVFACFREDPLCLQLKSTLTAYQIFLISNTYDVFEIEDQEFGIRCVWFDTDANEKAKEYRVDTTDELYPNLVKPQIVMLFREDMSETDIKYKAQIMYVVDITVDGKQRYGSIDKWYRDISGYYINDPDVREQNLKWFKGEKNANRV